MYRLWRNLICMSVAISPSDEYDLGWYWLRIYLDEVQLKGMSSFIGGMTFTHVFNVEFRAVETLHEFRFIVNRIWGNFCPESLWLVIYQSEFCRGIGHTWVQKWKTPLKSDDFRRTAVGTTHIILLGHIMACWKDKSLNCIGEIVSALF